MMAHKMGKEIVLSNVLSPTSAEMGNLIQEKLASLVLKTSKLVMQMEIKFQILSTNAQTFQKTTTEYKTAMVVQSPLLNV
jgi:hypothetical protein